MLTKMRPAAVNSAEFFARTKARLTFDVPPGLIDPNIIPRTGDAGNDLIETYSFGMRQKVSVAAAMLHDPPLVLLDEPLGGLDPKSARALKDLLRDPISR